MTHFRQQIHVKVDEFLYLSTFLCTLRASLSDSIRFFSLPVVHRFEVGAIPRELKEVPFLSFFFFFSFYAKFSIEFIKCPRQYSETLLTRDTCNFFYIGRKKNLIVRILSREILKAWNVRPSTAGKILVSVPREKRLSLVTSLLHYLLYFNFSDCFHRIFYYHILYAVLYNMYNGLLSLVTFLRVNGNKSLILLDRFAQPC